MTKQEILMELNFIVDAFDLDKDKIIIIGKASEVLCTGKEDPTIDNIEVWTDPEYYNSLAEDQDLIENLEIDYDPIRNIGFSFYYYKGNGNTKFYHGDLIGPKPRSKQIQGYYVQVLVQEAE